MWWWWSRWRRTSSEAPNVDSDDHSIRGRPVAWQTLLLDDFCIVEAGVAIIVEAGVAVEAEWILLAEATSLLAAPLPTLRIWPLKETDSRDDLPEADVEVTEAPEWRMDTEPGPLVERIDINIKTLKITKRLLEF